MKLHEYIKFLQEELEKHPEYRDLDVVIVSEYGLSYEFANQLRPGVTMHYVVDFTIDHHNVISLN